MIKVDHEHYMCFLYYIEEISEDNTETTLKRVDNDYVDDYKSTVNLSYGQFADYMKANNHAITKLFFNDSDFLAYFIKREDAVQDSDEHMIVSRIYDSYVYNTIITANTVDKESLNRIKLKHGNHYRDDLYEESFEVVTAFVHQECKDKRMAYWEYREWIQSM